MTAPLEVDLLGFIVKQDDISAKEIASNWSNLSHSPQRVAVQQLTDRMHHFAAVAAEFVPLASTPEKTELLTVELQAYAERYDQHFKAWIHANGRTASAFITGPSKFPTRRNEKRMRSVELRYEEWTAFSSNRLARIRKALRRIDRAASEPVEEAREKLGRLQALQEEYKRINKASRHRTPVGALMALGYSGEKAKRMVERDDYGEIGVPAYLLTNNRAEIRRLLARVTELERLASIAEQPELEEVYGKIIFRLAPDIDRVQLEFPYKPSGETIKLLKSRGFRYSRTNEAWQRQLTENGIRAAREVAQQLDEQNKLTTNG